MNIEDVNLEAISILTTRVNVTSTVEVEFTVNALTIKASMRCPNQLQYEAETQDKILKYLGFSGEQIKGLHYD